VSLLADTCRRFLCEESLMFLLAVAEIQVSHTTTGAATAPAASYALSVQWLEGCGCAWD
jgi:hypothetical protein